MPRASSRGLSMVVALALFLLPRPLLAGGKPVPAPSARDKCPVCGMFVAKYPDWACAIRFRDGSTAWFDGSKDLFTFLLDVRKHAPAKTRADVLSVLVKDYYALKLVDAEKAYFVVGSDVRGPMGSELVPFERLEDAKAFLKDHGGRKVLRMGEITPALLASMP